eukprot:6199978-Pleurochrysis_carterae.AAC.1
MVHPLTTGFAAQARQWLFPATQSCSVEARQSVNFADRHVKINSHWRQSAGLKCSIEKVKEETHAQFWAQAKQTLQTLGTVEHLTWLTFPHGHIGARWQNGNYTRWRTSSKRISDTDARSRCRQMYLRDV